MKSILKTLAAGAAVLSSIPQVHGQYAPPPPPAPFAGFLNEALRKNDPYMSKWDIGGSVRVRYELKEGFGIAGVGAGATASADFRDHGSDVYNDYALTKIRLRGAYADKWWSAMMEGRGSFASSDERFAYPNNPAVAGTTLRQGDGPESDTLDLHQAYVTLGNHKEFPLSLKVGRQELSYGEERMIGAFAWNNLGRVFDAAKLRWQNAWFAADFFSSRVVIPEDGHFNVSNDYDWFSGIYATSTRIPKHTLDVYLLARNSSASAAAAEPAPQALQPGARDIYTLGARLSKPKPKAGEPAAWDYSLEAAGQAGDFRDTRLGVNSARLDHLAYMGVAQGGYTFAETWGTPRIGLEYSHASGDSDPNDGKHETFENLFPTNHKFYGYMDFVSLQNLHNIRGIIELKPHPRLSVALEGHAFWLANTHDNFYNVAGAPRGGVATTPGTAYGINPTYGSFVGTESDLIVGYALTRYAQLEAGYGHFFVGDYIKRSLSAPTRGSQDADYVYLQATLNF